MQTALFSAWIVCLSVDPDTNVTNSAYFLKIPFARYELACMVLPSTGNNITKQRPFMKPDQAHDYPVTARLKNYIWLHTNLHPFGFFADDDGKPSIDIRISDQSLLTKVSLKDRIEFMVEAHRRMCELGYLPQKGFLDAREWMIQTQAQGVIWYSLPA